MSALISVIVPAYNSEKWLEECCESVLCQTYQNIELIVVNDGSTDNTPNLLNDIQKRDKRIRVIHTDNGGVCRARNTGIDAAKGDYLVFLDADDVMLENALELLYNAADQASADIAIGWKSDMTFDGKAIGCPYERIAGVFEGTDGLRLSLEDHPSMYAVWGKLYRRSAIGDIRFVEGKKVHEDSFFVFECLLKQPRVVICKEIVIFYRHSENSATRCAFSEKVFDILYFADRKRAAVERLYPQFRDLVENVIVKANMALLWNLLKTDDPKYREAERIAIKNVLVRKRFYKQAIQSDGKLFWVISHHLYGVFKVLHIARRTLSSQKKR